jgi:hypothetical protein
MDATLPPPLTWDEAYTQFGRQYWEEILRTHGNVTQAARAGHVNRTNLYKLLSRFKVRLPRRRPGIGGNLAWRELADEIHPVPGGGGQRLPVDRIGVGVYH